MENEQTFLDSIQKILESRGCQVWREVIPNECKMWSNPYRVDMIFFRRDIGYIGVEGKYLNTYSAGSKIAEAVEQIKRYRGLQYFDKFIMIPKWALCLHHFEYSDGREGWSESNRRVGLFVQNFLRHYNISWLEYGTDVVLDSFTRERIDI